MIIMGKICVYCVKYVTTTQKNALKTRAVRFTCPMNILVKVRAEGKREIIKFTNFVKNAEISRWNVYFVFKLHNKTLHLTFSLVLSYVLKKWNNMKIWQKHFYLIEKARKSWPTLSLFSGFGMWPIRMSWTSHVVKAESQTSQASGFGTR